MVCRETLSLVEKLNFWREAIQRPTGQIAPVQPDMSVKLAEIQAQIVAVSLLD